MTGPLEGWLHRGWECRACRQRFTVVARLSTTHHGEKNLPLGERPSCCGKVVTTGLWTRWLNPERNPQLRRPDAGVTVSVTQPVRRFTPGDRV